MLISTILILGGASLALISTLVKKQFIAASAMIFLVLYALTSKFSIVEFVPIWIPDFFAFVFFILVCIKIYIKFKSPNSKS